MLIKEIKALIFKIKVDYYKVNNLIKILDKFIKLNLRSLNTKQLLSLRVVRGGEILNLLNITIAKYIFN